jgi:hypothetical protein
MNSLPLEGVIDIHAHTGPDSIPREIDALDLARMAKQRGMRGIVLKNHYEPTASLAYVVRKEVPGIEVFGGITLNRAIGGMNPTAIERMALVTGGLGRFVWMGSLDTESQVRYEHSARPYVQITHSSELLPEVKEVIDVIANRGLVLATGHSTADEILLLIREARRRRVRHIVVTHAMMAPIHMSCAQMEEAVSLGALIEFVYNGLIGPFKEFDFPDYARAIRTLGAAHCVLASDLGQTENPFHPDGLVEFFAGLKAQGISDREIEIMTRHNPACLLGLEL